MTRARRPGNANQIPAPGAVLALAWAALHLALGGCVGPQQLPATPNVLRDGSGSQVLAQLPQEQHVVGMPIIYVTDRARVSAPDQPPAYGTKRSPFASFGQATVSFTPAPTWEELVSASGSAPDGHHLSLGVTGVEELGNFSFTAASFEVVDGNLRFRPEAAEVVADRVHQVTDLVRTRLAAGGHKDVYLYVHGVDNSFEDALCRAAVIWHSIGRRGVMVAYAWPAGQAGALGYFYDRESGEFSVCHLKRLITGLAECPEVERIHVVAHSRGCDVVTTALREINLECRARGLSTSATLKLDTLVLAAADLDAAVFGMRMQLENLAAVARHVVIYSSTSDRAVEFADWLFSSRARLGTLTKEEVDPPMQELLAQIPSLQCVRCAVSGTGNTHDYLFTNPGAMSDLILVLRDGKEPGAANGRPLTPLGGAFWLLDNSYALPPPAASTR